MLDRRQSWRLAPPPVGLQPLDGLWLRCVVHRGADRHDAFRADVVKCRDILLQTTRRDIVANFYQDVRGQIAGNDDGRAAVQFEAVGLSDNGVFARAEPPSDLRRRYPRRPIVA